MANLITIGIPAYNRKEALLHVLADLVRQGVHQMPGIEVLVIDDASPDDTYSAALPYHGMGGIRVLRNETRQGFRGNFGKLIAHCETEYLMYSCDDDFVLGAGIAQLHAHLAAETAPPALLSSLYYEKGEVYRANPDRIEEIGLGEYRNCCAHLPGVVFNARLARSIWPRIEHVMLDPRNVYPQCCLALVMLLFGYRGMYYPVELVRTGFDLESGIVAYATVGERWKQFLFFHDLLEHLAAHIQDDAVQARARQLLEQHKLSLFRTLGNGVSVEKPELAAYFLQGARQHLGA